MILEIKGRNALVVGGSGGMGSAIAKMLAAQGVTCGLVGRSLEKLEITANACAELGAPAHIFICDISDGASIKTCVANAINQLGGLNYLINCAGYYNRAKAHECELETWDHILDTNVRSTYHFLRHSLPEINKAPWGAVIRINSLEAIYPGSGIQTAQKRAIDGYAEALFEDVREYGTKVCTIQPGFTNTPHVKPGRVNRELMIQPEDIAETVKFVLLMPETACPTEILIRPQRSPWKTEADPRKSE